MTQTFDDINPATGEVIASIPVSSEREIQRVVQRAKWAQEGWGAMPIENRAELLRAGADRLAPRVNEIAVMITREMGKPLGDATREVRGWIEGVGKMTQEVIEALAPQTLESQGSESRLMRDPHGVVAAISPWNFPFHVPMELIVPALMAGNSVVFKPSEMTTQVGALLVEVFAPVLPDNVLQLVQGPGQVGAQLVASDVDMVGFVGSRETGMAIMKSAGNDLKRLVLELGGKDPLLVFGDADLDLAAESVVRNALRNTGQVCCAVERVYVESSVAQDFAARVVSKAKTWNYGDGLNTEAKMGPMVSAAQRDKVVSQVQAAVDAGAEVLLGGVCDDGPGFFYPATVLVNVGQDSPMTAEETFGPVIALTTFDGSEKQGIEFANDTAFGLGANIWTADSDKGLRVASRIRAGQIGINRFLCNSSAAPWAGARQSGFGFTGGPEGHRQFSVPKSVSLTLEA